MSVTKWPPCEVCKKPVSTQQGGMVIYGEELTEFMKLHKEWEEKHPRDDSGGRMLDAAALDDYPLTVEWHLGHLHCLNEGVYQIAYGRFDTVEKALAWTLKLMEKTWLDYTNWVEVVPAIHKLPVV